MNQNIFDIKDSFYWDGSYDDMTCDLDNIVMRIEQMDSGLWWWGVYMDNKYMEMGFDNSKRLALEQIEKVYDKYINANK